MAYINTIFPGYTSSEFFSDENISFIRNKIADVLNGEFYQRINFDRASVIRIMMRVLEERLESIPKMNQRVLMYLGNEYRNHQADLHKKLKCKYNYVI
jgi:hypothetical protein